jgi:hypothetical protein
MSEVQRRGLMMPVSGFTKDLPPTSFCWMHSKTWHDLMLDSKITMHKDHPNGMFKGKRILLDDALPIEASVFIFVRSYGEGVR